MAWYLKAVVGEETVAVTVSCAANVPFVNNVQPVLLALLEFVSLPKMA